MNCTIAWSSSSPAVRIEASQTMPESAITAMSVVPPPMSTIMLPVGLSTGSPAPIAAAIGSDTMKRRLTPAASVESRTARRSTSVMLEGTHTSTVGLTRRKCRSSTCLRNRRSICSAMLKSAITPSFIGRTARIPSGVRPSMRLASWPTPRIAPVALSTAATDGSFRTTPSPRTSTRVLAVPRSTAICRAGRQVRRSGRLVSVGVGSGSGSRAAVTRAVLPDAGMWQNSGAMAFHATGVPAERRFQRIGVKVSKIRASGGTCLSVVGEGVRPGTRGRRDGRLRSSR